MLRRRKRQAALYTRRRPPHFERRRCQAWLRPELPSRKQEAAGPANAKCRPAARHTESRERLLCWPARSLVAGRSTHGALGRSRWHAKTRKMRTEAEAQKA